MKSCHHERDPHRVASPHVGECPEIKCAADNAASDSQRLRKVSRFGGLLLAALWAGPALAAPSLQLSLWEASPKGSVTEGGRVYDIRQELGVRRDNLVGLELGYGHWPARLQDIDLEGEGEIEADGQPLLFGLISLGGGTAQVRSRVNVNEWALRWEPLHWGPLRLGASLRYLDGVLDAREGDTIGAQEVEDVFPLLSAGLHWPLGAGFAASAAGQWVAYEGDEVYEAELGLHWAWEQLRLDLGYRQQRYEVGTGDGDALDLSLRGWTLRWGWSF